MSRYSDGTSSRHSALTGFADSLTVVQMLTTACLPVFGGLGCLIPLASKIVVMIDEMSRYYSNLVEFFEKIGKIIAKNS